MIAQSHKPTSSASVLRLQDAINFCFWLSVLFCLSQMGQLHGQQVQKAPNSRFEVAAIRPGDSKMGSYSSTSVVAGQFNMTNLPLREWLKMAFSIQDYALEAPAATDALRFDLHAKIPYGVTFDEKAKADMVRALLVDRFGLKWHEQMQNVTGYELITDKVVLLKPSGILDRLQGRGAGFGPSFIGETNMPLSDLATALERALGRPVVDRTQLSGVYTFRLLWRPADDAIAAEERHHGIDVDNLPATPQAALKEQLGLNLRKAALPAKVIVVDSIAHDPTAN